jgi:hypothetical protein
MEAEGASGLWLFAVVGGPLILAIFLLYGVWQWRHRRRRLDDLREAATRVNYSQENGAVPKPGLAKEAPPEDETRL